MNIFIIILISYFIGSISPSYIFGKIYKMDIRKKGSGNAGTTNTLRVLGKKVALAVFLIDFFKGFLLVFFVRRYFTMEYALIAGVFVVLGHIYTVFLGFKGGKGVATTFGVLYCLFFTEVFICSILGLVILYITRYVSLSGLITLLNTNILMFLLDVEIRYIYFTFFLFCIVTFKHKENIKRLINHTERKLGEK